MRRKSNIFTLIILALAMNVGFASTTGNKKSKSGNQEQQEGERKSDQTAMQPDGVYGSSAYQEPKFQEESTTASQSFYEAGTSENSLVESDSVEDDSVSKYNFIFYFLYKFKYDSEESP